MHFNLTLLCIFIAWGQGFGQSPIRAGLVEVNGIELYCEVYGKGAPLLLLHGWTQSSQSWREYIPGYTGHFEVYVPDLRGHGKSTPLNGDFSIGKASLDILALLDYLKIEKVKAVGLSYGGLALLQLASIHPERIESMILIGTSQRFKGGAEIEDKNAFLYENLPDEFLKSQLELHKGGEPQVRALFDPKLHYEIALRDEQVKLIGAKTLIIHGDRDELVGVEAAVILYRTLPSAELWVLPNTGHNAIIGANKEPFLERSLQFLLDKETVK